MAMAALQTPVSALMMQHTTDLPAFPNDHLLQGSDSNIIPTSPPPGATLRLRGLMFSADVQIIKNWFAEAGYQLAEVFICRRNGRANGEAYVIVEGGAEQAQKAMAELNRKIMPPGTRYIEIFEARDGDLATAKALTVDRLRGYVVRMRGLPYSASATDVLRFLDGIEVVRGIEGVIFTWTPDGRPTGEAFVELQDADAQAAAMRKHKEMMGTRYIEMFTSTKAALVQAIQHNRLILGFSNRRKWLQQAGVPTQVVAGIPGAMTPVITTTNLGVDPSVSPCLDDVTNSLAGMRVMATRQQDLMGSPTSLAAAARPRQLSSGQAQILQQSAFLAGQQGLPSTTFNSLPQTYIIQQPTTTYVDGTYAQGGITLDNTDAFANIHLKSASPTQYILTPNGQTYTLQTLQLPATSNSQLGTIHSSFTGGHTQQLPEIFQLGQQLAPSPSTTETQLTAGFMSSGSLPMSSGSLPVSSCNLPLNLQQIDGLQQGLQQGISNMHILQQ